MKKSNIFLIASTFLLSACGGGGGGSSQTITPIYNPPSRPIQIQNPPSRPIQNQPIAPAPFIPITTPIQNAPQTSSQIGADPNPQLNSSEEFADLPIASDVLRRARDLENDSDFKAFSDSNSGIIKARRDSLSTRASDSVNPNITGNIIGNGNLDFNWHRLNPNTKVINAIRRDNKLYYDLTDIRKYFVADDAAKVLVFDNSLNNQAILAHDVYKPLYVNQAIGTHSNKELVGNAMHGDAVAYILIGQNPLPYFSPLTIYQYDLENKIYRLGFLDNLSRSVSFLGTQPNSARESFYGIYSNEIRQQIADGYKIINFSIGREFNRQSSYLNIQQTRSDFTSDIKYLNKLVSDNDLLFVFALGNGKDRQFSTLAYIGEAFKDEYRKYYDSQITVGNYNPSLAKNAASSNLCHETKNTCLFAPGLFDMLQHGATEYGLETSDNTKSITGITGTSFAAPYVSGVAAAIRAIYPFLDARGIQQTLLTTATDLTPNDNNRVDEAFGWGLIDPVKAINGPAQLQGDSDFIVNFNHNTEFLKENETYNFSNDISGDKGLIVSGYGKRNSLSLSGYNTYSGNTVIQNDAALNVDGVLTNSTILIGEHGHLYGSGYVRRVYNDGTLNNYSIYATNLKNTKDVRSTGGLVIEGKYTQGDDATLNTLLGQPLLVKGKAFLGGTVNVVGIKKLKIIKSGDDIEIQGAVLAAKGKITNNFKKVNTKTPLLKDPRLNEPVQLGDNNVITVNATYNGTDIQSRLSDTPDVENYQATNGLRAFGKVLTALSASDTDSHSGLQAFASDVLFSSNLKSSLSLISATQYADAYLQAKSLANIASNYTKNALLDTQSGYKFNYSFSRNFGNQNSIKNLNFAGFSYGSDIFNTNINISQISDNWDNKQNIKGYGLGVGINTPLGNFARINYNLGILDLKNEIIRSGQIGDKGFYWDNKYSQKHLFTELFLSNNLYDFTTYYGLGLQRTMIGASTEKYDSFNLSVNRQNITDKYIFAGLKYATSLLNTDIGFGYFIKMDLDKKSGIVGSISDTSLSIPINIKSQDYHAFSQNFNIFANKNLTKSLLMNAKVSSDFRYDKSFTIGLSYKF